MRQIARVYATGNGFLNPRLSQMSHRALYYPGQTELSVVHFREEKGAGEGPDVVSSTDGNPEALGDFFLF